MSFKIDPSKKYKTVTFDEYKLLDNQVDRLAEVMDRMNTTQCKQNQSVSATYLDKVEMSREDALKAQEPFSLTDQFTKMGTLLEGRVLPRVLCQSNIILGINPCMGCQSSAQKVFVLEMEKLVTYFHYSCYHNNIMSHV